MHRSSWMRHLSIPIFQAIAQLCCSTRLPPTLLKPSPRAPKLSQGFGGNWFKTHDCQQVLLASLQEVPQKWIWMEIAQRYFLGVHCNRVVSTCSSWYILRLLELCQFQETQCLATGSRCQKSTGFFLGQCFDPRVFCQWNYRYCQYGPSSFFGEHQLSMILGVLAIHLWRNKLMSCAKLGQRTSRPGWRPVVKTRRILRRPAWEAWHVSHRRARERSAVNWQMRRVSIINIPENVTQWKLGWGIPTTIVLGVFTQVSQLWGKTAITAKLLALFWTNAIAE